MSGWRHDLEDALLDGIGAALPQHPELTLAEVEALVPGAYIAARAKFMAGIRAAWDEARELDEGAAWLDEREKKG